MKDILMDWLKKIAIMLGATIVSAIVAVLILTLVQFLPHSLIDKNAYKSTEVFMEEGTNPVSSEKFDSVRDNDTDAEMILVASYDGELSALQQALLVHWPEGNPVQSLLVKYYDTAVEPTYVSYGRYWHGNQIIVRVLLMFMSYAGIRVFSKITFILGIALTCYLLIRRGNVWTIFPYAISILLLVPSSIFNCMTFSLCFYVGQLVVHIYLLNQDYFEEKNRFLWLCLATGILTNFFDLMTYPMYPLGMLLCIRMITIAPDMLKEIKESIFHCIAWVIGYGGLWVSKWTLVTLLTDYNMFADALSTVSYRSGTAEVDRFGAYHDNLAYFFGNKAALAIMCVYIVVALAYKIYKKQLNVRDFVIFGIICLFPFAWYTVANQQTWWHAFFACKALAVFSMALMCMCTWRPAVESK